MDRREAILAFVMLGAACAPPTAFAQPLGKVWRVGVLLPASRPASLSPEAAALLRGLQALGYAEGKNLQMDGQPFVIGCFLKFFL